MVTSKSPTYVGNPISQSSVPPEEYAILDCVNLINEEDDKFEGNEQGKQYSSENWIDVV